MAVDVGDQTGNPVIHGAGVHVSGLGVQGGPVQENEKFQQEDAGVERACELSRPVQGALQSLQQGQKGGPVLPAGPDHAGMPVLGSAKALVQGIGQGILLEKRGGEVEDHPLVGLPVLHVGAMDLPAVHQHQVPRLRLIGPALHDVIHRAGDEDQNLAEVVVVGIEVPGTAVRQMEQPVVPG